MNDQQNKWKQRQALESCYSNFVEPYVNQLIEVKDGSSLPVSVAFYGFCFASGWLLLTFVCCMLMRWREKWRQQKVR